VYVHPVNALTQRVQIEYQFSLGRGQIERSSFPVSLLFDFRFSDASGAKCDALIATRSADAESGKSHKRFQNVKNDSLKRKSVVPLSAPPPWRNSNPRRIGSSSKGLRRTFAARETLRSFYSSQSSADALMTRAITRVPEDDDEDARAAGVPLASFPTKCDF